MKILMVCLGNICRSPLAEGIMREKITRYQLEASVDSAGTSGWHEGENPDRRAIYTASKFGIDISTLIARQVKPHDLDEFDHVYVMDTSNLEDVLALARHDNHREKIKLILDEVKPEGRSVPDPYYGGQEGFDHVFRMLDEACEKICKKMTGS